MLAQMDGLMVPFAIFYLMIAALAVAVWMQLGWGNFGLRAIKPSSRRDGRRNRARVANSRHDSRSGHQPNRPAAG